jgi:type I restriction enzyme S subunit
MSSEWKVFQASKVCGKHKSAMSTGPFGSAISSRFFVNSGVPVIRGGNLSQDVGTRLSHEDLVFITEDKAREFERSTVKHGDLIFTCWGTIDQVGLIDERSHYEEYVISNKQMKMTPDPAMADSRFLYYQFSSPKIRSWIIDNGIGSSVPGFNLGMLKSIELNIPPLPEQKAIAHILGTLDDKIELNRKTNETLEAMAKALFKSWFVDFDPVRAKAEGRPTGLPAEISDLFPDSFEDSELGEIPSGWEVGGLEKFLVLQRGFDLPSPLRIKGAYPVVAASGISGTHNESMASAPGVVTGRSGVLGKVFYIQTDFFPLNTTLWAKEFRLATPIYGYFLLSDIDFAVFNAGSAVPTLNRNHLGSLRFPLPPKAIVVSFTEVAANLMKRKEGIVAGSFNLSATRDTLLPKLISGELRIPDAEKLLDEAGI